MEAGSAVLSTAKPAVDCLVQTFFPLGPVASRLEASGGQLFKMVYRFSATRLFQHLDRGVTHFHLKGPNRVHGAAAMGLSLGLCLTLTCQPAFSLNDPAATPVLRHRISKGQTLAKLAVLYHVPREAVLAANTNLDPHHISIGSVVQIPAPASGWRLYKTSPSDTLDSICQSSGLEPDAIRNLNPHLVLEDSSANLNAPYLQLPPLEQPNELPTPAVNNPVAGSTSGSALGSATVAASTLTNRDDSAPILGSDASRNGPSASKSPLEGGTGWVEVRMADGTRAWAPRAALLGYSRTPQSANTVVATAKRFAGVPYAWGGVTPNGVDCSGFVHQVFLMSGYQIPRMADDQYNACQNISEEQAQPGDLVFFSTYLPGPSHVGIYLGQRRFLHASSSRGVVESTLDESYYKERYLGIRRIAPWANTANSAGPSDANPHSGSSLPTASQASAAP